ncbi:MAG: DUF2971 domain-containing protein [Candidatus Poribacteria bacterium]|nr:DUF2971 domain-containing protein [Candidatus Poribacteria bacterium]
MTEYYRFRNIEYLIGDEYRELEDQTIYFASPDELNDPMEGFQDMVWSGDKIVWTNLFKHFAISLHEFMLGLKEGVVDFNADSIPIWHSETTPQAEEWRKQIWNSFRDVGRIHTIIEAIANMNRKIRYRELRYYLTCIYGIVLGQILKSHAAYGIIPKPIESVDGSSQMRIVEGLLTFIRRVGDDDSGFDDILMSIENIRIIERITGRYNYSTSATSGTMFSEFPEMYVEQLKRLLWPKWYTACFTASYHNSSLWGHYADKHKGVCLIFETVGTGQPNFEKRFHKVNYVDRLPLVDFFRSIGTAALDSVMKHWYTDENGNVSECASQEREIAWQQTLWRRFICTVTSKTRDWEYENEYRIIANEVSLGDDNENDHTLSYKFSLLKGIIFGIKTSDGDKRKIIEIVKRKCEEHNRTDFQLSQAYYSHRYGNIRAEKIQL